jgi:predicted ATP-dependent endonuclease of OLD family
MSKIRIKNFGPIKEGYQENDGWMDVKKVTLFIGNQGSGKSTVAKVISTLTWLEKAINRGDVESEKISHDDFFHFFEYQRVKNYFNTDTEIEYIGDKISLKYSKGLDSPEITKIENKEYAVPKIMYVPSERNFLSVVKKAYGIKNLPDTLYTFAEELRKGQLELNDDLVRLPIGELNFKYNKDNDSSTLIGSDYEVNLLESSSGYQSLVPLYLVTKFLTDDLQKESKISRDQLDVYQSVRRKEEIAALILNGTVSENDIKAIVGEVSARYINTCFINIVEEPEQNLFPNSQWEILKILLEYNNLKKENKLILTTHSPYIINFLSIAIQGDYLKHKILLSNDPSELLNKLIQVVPENSLISSNDTIVYQLDETNGSIKKLSSSEGIPSDKNYLNNMLREGNRLFDSLLEIEEQL